MFSVVCDIEGITMYMSKNPEIQKYLQEILPKLKGIDLDVLLFLLKRNPNVTV